jgi:hypothetical protein
LIALAIFASAPLYIYHQISSTAVAEAQTSRRQRGTRTQAKPRTQSRNTRQASSFSFNHENHRLPKAKLTCSDCHIIPAREAPDEIAAATKATIKGFPYHDSCLECHRTTQPQFFRGATPSICTACHTRSSPRLTARDMSPFPKQNEQAMEFEFPGFFPHDHRDHKRVNCATCHVTDARAYPAIPVGGSEALYKPAQGTFKTSPFGHAACFKCHWDEKPMKDDCAGCHLTPEPIAKKRQELFPPSLMDWFKSWPREWPRRMSIKFNHESKSHDDECISCHDIARLQTLDIPKPDVPIAPCAKCHLKPATPANIGKEMFEEDEDIAEGRNNTPTSKEGKHTCTGCHSTVIGSAPPPCSHYLLFEATYLKLEDYPKSARQIAGRCKK